MSSQSTGSQGSSGGAPSKPALKTKSGEAFDHDYDGKDINRYIAGSLKQVKQTPMHVHRHNFDVHNLHPKKLAEDASYNTVQKATEKLNKEGVDVKQYEKK